MVQTEGRPNQFVIQISFVPQTGLSGFTRDGDVIGYKSHQNRLIRTLSAVSKTFIDQSHHITLQSSTIIYNEVYL